MFRIGCSLVNLDTRPDGGSPFRPLDAEFHRHTEMIRIAENMLREQGNNDPGDHEIENEAGRIAQNENENPSARDGPQLTSDEDE
jgi:hypothetical protein